MCISKFLGDIIKRAVGGYIIVQGRDDEILNPGGVKVLLFQGECILRNLLGI